MTGSLSFPVLRVATICISLLLFGFGRWCILTLLVVSYIRNLASDGILVALQASVRFSSLLTLLRVLGLSCVTSCVCLLRWTSRCETRLRGCRKLVCCTRLLTTLTVLVRGERCSVLTSRFPCGVVSWQRLLLDRLNRGECRVVVSDRLLLGAVSIDSRVWTLVIVSLFVSPSWLVFVMGRPRRPSVRTTLRNSVDWCRIRTSMLLGWTGCVVFLCGRKGRFITLCMVWEMVWVSIRFVVPGVGWLIGLNYWLLVGRLGLGMGGYRLMCFGTVV